MSKCLLQHLFILKELSKAKPSKRKVILDQADRELVRCIVECVDNVLKGNITLKDGCLKKLTRHKSTLRKIQRVNNVILDKKNAIVQSGGGFLPALLIPVITVLAERLLR